MLFSAELSYCSKVVKKGWLRTPNCIFMSFKNGSTLRLVSVGSSMENSRSSLGNSRESDVFSLSNTEHLHRNAQSCIRTSCPVLRQ